MRKLSLLFSLLCATQALRITRYNLRRKRTTYRVAKAIGQLVWMEMLLVELDGQGIY